jgi:very-short-patch-repair endonuclease
VRGAELSTRQDTEIALDSLSKSSNIMITYSTIPVKHKGWDELGYNIFMYKFQFNNQSLKNRRRELRANQTYAEKKLWEFLRGRRFHGLKFHRQFSIGAYILDFYCPKARIGIELDGSIHTKNESVLYDKNREGVLQTSNVKVIRFWNDEVENDIEKVLSEIKKGQNAILTP